MGEKASILLQCIDLVNGWFQGQDTKMSRKYFRKYKGRVPFIELIT